MMRRLLSLCGAVLLLLAALTACADKTGYAQDGFADGALEDTMHTRFFDFTIHSASLTNSFDGYTPPEGYQLLEAEITITNTYPQTLPMSFLDFQVQWGEERGAGQYGYPVCLGEEDDFSTYTTVSDQQLPVLYDLKVDETREGVLLYEVPRGETEFSISYQEYFDDGTEGDVFFVYVTCQEA